MVFETTMTPDEARLGQVALNYLAAHINAARHFRGQIEPLPSSPWLADQSLPYADDGQSIAGVSLGAADFYLDAVSRWMQSGLDPVSGYALLRGAGEASARAWWLLDPTVSGETRRDRGLTARLEIIIERSKAVGDDNGRLQHLLQSTEAAGIQPRTDRRNKVIGFGDPQPSATDLFEKVARSTAVQMPEGFGGFVYRFLSAHAHTVPWALLMEATASPSRRPGVSIAGLDINIQFYVICLEVVVAMYEAAHRQYIELHGRLEEWLRVAQELPGPLVVHPSSSP